MRELVEIFSVTGCVTVYPTNSQWFSYYFPIFLLITGVKMSDYVNFPNKRINIRKFLKVALFPFLNNTAAGDVKKKK